MAKWKRLKTAAYHSEGNGLTERLNGMVIKMFRMICEEVKGVWDSALPTIMLAYNSTVHSSTDLTSFAPYVNEVVGMRSDAGSEKVKQFRLRQQLQVVYERVLSEIATRHRMRMTSVIIRSGTRFR